MAIASKWQIGRVANLNYPPRAEAFRLRSREVVMNAIHWIIAAAAFAFIQPTPAQAAQGGPEIIIYRFSGVKDDGGAANVGVGTAFLCTNFSGVPETLRLVTRHFDGSLAGNSEVVINHLSTKASVTHLVAPYTFDLNLMTGFVQSGTTAIAATSTNIVCTAMVLDAANPKPDGVVLRGIRFSPVPGSQE